MVARRRPGGGRRQCDARGDRCLLRFPAADRVSAPAIALVETGLQQPNLLAALNAYRQELGLRPLNPTEFQSIAGNTVDGERRPARARARHLGDIGGGAQQRDLPLRRLGAEHRGHQLPGLPERVLRQRAQSRGPVLVVDLLLLGDAAVAVPAGVAAALRRRPAERRVNPHRHPGPGVERLAVQRHGQRAGRHRADLRPVGRRHLGLDALLGGQRRHARELLPARHAGRHGDHLRAGRGRPDNLAEQALDGQSRDPDGGRGARRDVCRRAHPADRDGVERVRLRAARRTSCMSASPATTRPRAASTPPSRCRLPERLRAHARRDAEAPTAMAAARPTSRRWPAAMPTMRC